MLNPFYPTLIASPFNHFVLLLLLPLLIFKQNDDQADRRYTAAGSQVYYLLYQQFYSTFSLFVRRSNDAIFRYSRHSGPRK
jgi:hypothetical protein